MLIFMLMFVYVVVCLFVLYCVLLSTEFTVKHFVNYFCKKCYINELYILKNLLHGLSWENWHTHTSDNCVYQVFIKSFNSAFNKCLPVFTSKKTLVGFRSHQNKRKGSIKKKSLANPTTLNQNNYEI